MRTNTAILIIFFLLFLVGTVAALSVETHLSPQIVSINDPTDIIITVTGNGHDGTNAIMNLDFDTVEVSGTPMPGNQVFSYVPIGPFSPLKSVADPSGRTSIIWQNSSQSVIDQSNEWNVNHQLHFNIGSISTDDRWTATFRLRAKQTGTIGVFGDHSVLSFNGGSESQNIPQIFLVVIPHQSSVPEFPSIFLPATMIIGILGAVLLIQRTKEH
jgi:hypothetical protein